MVESEPKTRRLGYARVSTYGQMLDVWLERLSKESCKPICREEASGIRHEE